MVSLTRAQLVAYAALAVLVLVLGGQWLARRAASAGGGDAAAASAGGRGGGGSSGESSGAGGGFAAGGGNAANGSSAAGAGAGGESAATADGGGGLRVEDGSRAALVHVAGLVRRPGVYRLRPGARVQDAVRRAGGPTRRGDVNAINLAAPVQDGSQVVVPRRMPRAPAAAGASAAGATGAEGAAGLEPPAPPVSLNSATAEQLETLDGIGPATAAKILAYRQEHGGFRSIEDLAQVPGIGPKRLAALRDHVQL